MVDHIDFQVGTVFQSHEEFRFQLDRFEKQIKCNFSISSSKKLVASNAVSAENVDIFKYKYARFICKFGEKPRDTIGTNVRKRQTKSYKQRCPAYFSIGFKKVNNVNVLQIAIFNGEHSHALSDEFFKTLPKQRRQTIDEATPFLKHIVNVKPNYQLVQNEVRNTIGGLVKRRDLYNFKAKHVDTANEPDELQTMIQEMQSIKGAVIKILHNAENELEAVYFQDGRMKSCFQNYPDLLMFDGTYKLNDRRMPLVVLLVIDGNGESQIAGFFIVKSENAAILNMLFEEFKAANPNFVETNIIVTDKSLAFRNVIENQFPEALHHLCVFHVSQIFSREVTTKKRSINTEQRKNCLRILNDMIYADTIQRFDVLYEELMNSGCPGMQFYSKYFHYLFYNFFL